MTAADAVLVLELGEQDRLHLAAALAAHRRWCRAQGGDLPPGLAAWLGRLAAGGGGRRPVGAEAGPFVEPDAVTYEVAARRLGVAPRTVRSWVAAGRLPAVGSGRGRRIPVAALDAYLEAATPGTDEKTGA